MKHYIPASFSQGPVTSLQSMLRAIAFVEQQFPVISATGLFDEDTLEAVLRFQKQNFDRSIRFTAEYTIDRYTGNGEIKLPQYCQKVL